MALLADIIQAARDITGNKRDNSASETCIPDQAIQAEIAPAIRRINQALVGISAVKISKFSTVISQQSYDIESSVGSDVQEIVEVLRSSAYVGREDLVPSDVDPRNGLPLRRGMPVSVGFQSDTLDEILAISRGRVIDDQVWCIEADNLILMPTPTAVEIVRVKYISTSMGVDSIPDFARTCAVYAACAAILECVLNRPGNFAVPFAGSADQLDNRTAMARLTALKGQRDSYIAKFEAELKAIRPE